MSEAELKEEFAKNDHAKEYVLDPIKINHLRAGSNERDEIKVEDHPPSTGAPTTSQNVPNNPLEAPMREISFKESQDEEISEKSDPQSYQKTKDYVSYGYDYVSVEKDPQKVDPNLPIKDYVYQLLCNPNCTDEIFKEKMIEYQYYKDKKIDRQIRRLKTNLEKGK